MFNIWLIVLIAGLVIEILTVTLVSIWFALGAACALIAQSFGLSEIVQIIIFLVVSIVAIILTRPLYKKLKLKKDVKLNTDKNIGKRGYVTKPIAQYGSGQVKLDDTYWSARGTDEQAIALNTLVQVVDVEGAKLIVEEV